MTVLAPFERFNNSGVKRYISLAVIVLVLLLATCFGRNPSLTYFVAIGGAVGLVILLRRPELGLAFLLITALGVPYAISTGTQTPIHLAVVLIPLLLALWLSAMVLRKSVHLIPSIVNLPLICFVASATISLIVGNLQWNYFAGMASLQSQLGGWAIFSFSAGVFLLVANQIKDLKWLQSFTIIFLLIAGLVVLGRLVPSIATATSRLVVEPGAIGSLFWVWLVALAGGQAVFNRSLNTAVRLLLAALVVATLSYGYSLNRTWVSGWLPPLVALMTLAWLYSWRLGCVVTIAGGLAILIRDPGLVSGLVSAKQYSIDTRLEAWQIMFEHIVPINPVLGLGPANYYFYTPLFPILGYYVSFNSHNQYVDILAQTGVVGLAVFGWLMAAIAKVGWDLRHRVSDGFARGYVYGCLAGLIGSLYAGVHGDWFLPFVYNVGLAGFRASMLGWFFLGGLVAIEQMVRQQGLHRSVTDHTVSPALGSPGATVR